MPPFDAFDESGPGEYVEVVGRGALRDPRRLGHGGDSEAVLAEKTEDMESDRMSEGVGEEEELVGHAVRDPSKDFPPTTSAEPITFIGSRNAVPRRASDRTTTAETISTTASFSAPESSSMLPLAASSCLLLPEATASCLVAFGTGGSRGDTGI